MFYETTPVNTVATNLLDMSFVAFVAGGNADIYNGCEIEIIHENVPAAKINRLTEVVTETPCDAEVFLMATVKNQGTEPITSVEISYNHSSETAQTYTWEGTLNVGSQRDIDLPALPVPINETVNASASVVSINGESVTTAPMVISVKKNSYSSAGAHTFNIKTDGYGEMNVFKIFNSEGDIVLRGGPFTNESREYIYDFIPEEAGCYIITVTDDYGDGINAGLGEGYFEMIDAEGNIVFHNDGRFGSSISYHLFIEETSSVESYENTNKMTLSPNPASDVSILTLELEQNSSVDVAIYNMLGQTMESLFAGQMNSGRNEIAINVSNYPAGIYFVKAIVDGESPIVARMLVH